MSSVILKTNGEWLAWARKTAYYDVEVIADEINESPETIKNWEKTGEIAFEDLEKLAELYKRPTTIFFNDDEPEYPTKMPDFRTMESKKTSITPEIAFEIRKAKSRRETLLDLEEDLEDFTIPLFPFNKFKTENLNLILETLNEILNINSRAKTKRSLEYWINKVESLGVLVFEFYNISPEDLRGYALYYDKLPIIGINVRESEGAKKFTFFHELAHLILKKEGLSNINQYYLKNKDEILCNRIAAEILVPKNTLNNFIRDNSTYSKFTSSDIHNLSKIFKVSKQVIVRRALTLGHITKIEYDSRINEFISYIKPKKKIKNTKKEKNKSNNSIKKTDGSIGLHNKAVIALRKNGKYFTNSLFDAYEEELISDIDLSLELDIPLNVMRELKKIIVREDLDETS